jgi:hypothetical protein
MGSAGMSIMGESYHATLMNDGENTPPPAPGGCARGVM